MSHSTVLVVLDGAIDEITIDEALAAALEPFDENRETEEYIRKTRAQLIEDQRAEYTAYRDSGLYAEYLKDPAAYREKVGHNPEHFKYVSETFPNEILPILDDDVALYEKATEYSHDELDDEGNLLSTYNQLSKWDWYSIGGRWAGSVLNATTTIHHPEQVMSPKWTQPAWDELSGGVDVIRKRDLLQRRSTFAFLDRDGQWHEKGRMGWFGMVADEQEQQVWDDQLTALVDKVEADDWLVVVDVHI